MSDNPFAPPITDETLPADSHWQPLPRLIYARAVRFGLAAGLLGALAPVLMLTFGSGVPETLTVFAAGMTTGTLVSLAIARPMARWSAYAPPLFGVASLPVGAFLFGVLLTWLQFGAVSGGEIAFRFGQGVVEPIGVGLQYAWFAISRPLLPYTAPTAIATAYALRFYLRKPMPSRNGT